jgi:integrase
MALMKRWTQQRRRNRARKRPPESPPRKLPYIPPDDELRRIIEAAETERDRLILLLMYLAALRVSEVVKLEAADLDFASGFMMLRQAKGAKDGRLPIPKHLAGPLRGWLGSRKDGPLFVSPRGGRLSTRAVQYMVKRCAAKAGLFAAAETRRYHPHSFRHGAATNMMRRRVPLPIIQRVLRHANLNTTQQYMDVIPEDLREALGG